MPALDDSTWKKLEEAAEAACAGRGSGHDWLHVRRVTRLAEDLAQAEQADAELLRAAALLHELVNHPKNHPRSAQSGEDCARAVRELLAQVGADPAWAERVATCIEEHSWSAGKAPTLRESALLQDADRLDALGAIGLARCFATADRMDSLIHHPEDPGAFSREWDDKRYALDHLPKKLLRLPERLHSAKARELAGPRVGLVREFYEAMLGELGCHRSGSAGDSLTTRGEG